ncbi:MAG: hypothetical protein U1C72_00260, partial [Candidatus Pacearchaeota archaeon]|nr:hypothetical protein [Candidatus Pacearchaeota archaeon]
MTLNRPIFDYFSYAFRRDVDKFFIAFAIRNLAVGMVLIFEPIYLYVYFGHSLPLTFLYFAAIYIIAGLVSILGAKIMGRLGPHANILISYPFLFAYYASLFLLPHSPYFLAAAIFFAPVSIVLFWPAFHVDFVRFSSSQSRGKEVGLINVVAVLPAIAAPFIGGWVITSFGYPPLFIMVLLLLLASGIPLLYAKQTHESYADSYGAVFRKILSPGNWRREAVFAAASSEIGINLYVWPLFLFSLAIGFSAIGGIAAFSLFASGIFMLYVGRISDTPDRPWLLNVGAVMTSVSWVFKYFVRTPFDALLTDTIYRVSRSSAAIPYQTLFYERAAQQGGKADEYIVFREVVSSLARGFTFLTLAGLFVFLPHLSINSIFF